VCPQTVGTCACSIVDPRTGTHTLYPTEMAAPPLDDAVARRLATLTDSVESVQTMALWLTTQSRQARRTAEVWRDEMRRGAWLQPVVPSLVCVCLRPSVYRWRSEQHVPVPVPMCVSVKPFLRSPVRRSPFSLTYCISLSVSLPLCVSACLSFSLCVGATVPPAKKLVFLYVANEVIQRHRKQHGELVRELARVLPDAIDHVMRYAPACVRNCVCRCLCVRECVRLCLWISVSFAHSLTHSLTHSFAHSFAHSLTHSLTHSLCVCVDGCVHCAYSHADQRTARAVRHVVDVWVERQLFHESFLADLRRRLGSHAHTQTQTEAQRGKGTVA
jgi:hypothetical protein